MVIALCILTMSREDVIVKFARVDAAAATTIQKGQSFIVDWGIKYAKQFIPADELESELKSFDIQLLHYMSKQGVFASVDEMRHKYVGSYGRKGSKGACMFWAFYSYTAPLLSRVATALLSITPSEAAVERSFSAQGVVHSDRRNRLSNDNIEHEMFIKFNSRALSQQIFDPDECTELDNDVDDDSDTVE